MAWPPDPCGGWNQIEPVAPYIPGTYPVQQPQGTTEMIVLSHGVFSPAIGIRIGLESR